MSAREYSHPALWTLALLGAAGVIGWLFFHWLEIGRRHARDAKPLAVAVASAPVDHRALIADRSEAVLERGQQLYLRNCASCHGPEGDRNMTGSNPPPRNLRREPYQAEWGGGPYGFYLTLTKGWGQGMPSFTNLSPADRYAIVHFVRERWQRGTALYVAEDPPAVAAQIPQPGAAGDGPRTPPHLVDQPAALHPLLAVVARESAQRAARIEAAMTELGAEAGAELADLVAAVRAAPLGWQERLLAAAASGEAERVREVLLATESGQPALALAAPERATALIRLLLRIAGARA
ncbi:MAG: c-type cytochrome [Planctomycetota bacterium]|nr:c-type cytochrome [Planctomycetota bacterium]MCX8039874.1 c-type cytochrome [Planctomycetota bacterium]MDW8372167.1 c-type cytochrome [Planctomycetota bacterium]